MLRISETHTFARSKLIERYMYVFTPPPPADNGESLIYFCYRAPTSTDRRYCLVKYTITNF